MIGAPPHCRPMPSIHYISGYLGLPFEASEPYILGYLDGLRLDARGEGVACGRGWISRRRKCSKGKAAQTPEENLRKTREKQKSRQQLRAKVEASKGMKPRVINKKPEDHKIPDKLPHKSPKTPQEFIENGRAIAGPFLDEASRLESQVNAKKDELRFAEKSLQEKQRRVLSEGSFRARIYDELDKDPAYQKGRDRFSEMREERLASTKRYGKGEISFQEKMALNEKQYKEGKRINKKLNEMRVAKGEELIASDPRVKAAQSRVDKARTALRQVSEPAARLKRQLLESSAVSRADAEAISKKIKKPSGYRTKDPELPNQMADFFQITNGMGSTSLNRVTMTSQRAHATRDGLARYHGKNSHGVLWHEMGHHAEFANSSAQKAAREWVEGRATGQPQTLRSLTGRPYPSSERAYPDKFIDPYAGKVYRSGDTEVISMGLEHFSSPDSMVRLAAKDPDHFALILGITNAYQS